MKRNVKRLSAANLADKYGCMWVLESTYIEEDTRLGEVESKVKERGIAEKILAIFLIEIWPRKERTVIGPFSEESRRAYEDCVSLASFWGKDGALFYLPSVVTRKGVEEGVLAALERLRARRIEEEGKDVALEKKFNSFPRPDFDWFKSGSVGMKEWIDLVENAREGKRVRMDSQIPSETVRILGVQGWRRETEFEKTYDSPGVIIFIPDGQPCAPPSKEMLKEAEVAWDAAASKYEAYMRKQRERPPHVFVSPPEGVDGMDNDILTWTMGD